MARATRAWTPVPVTSMLIGTRSTGLTRFLKLGRGGSLARSVESDAASIFIHPEGRDGELHERRVGTWLISGICDWKRSLATALTLSSSASFLMLERMHMPGTRPALSA